MATPDPSDPRSSEAFDAKVRLSSPSYYRPEGSETAEISIWRRINPVVLAVVSAGTVIALFLMGFASGAGVVRNAQSAKSADAALLRDLQTQIAAQTGRAEIAEVRLSEERELKENALRDLGLLEKKLADAMSAKEASVDRSRRLEEDRADLESRLRAADAAIDSICKRWPDEHRPRACYVKRE